MQVYHHQENKIKPAPLSKSVSSVLHFPQSQRTRWIYFPIDVIFFFVLEAGVSNKSAK